MQKLITRVVGTFMFVLSAVVLGFSATALSTKVEAQSCTPCDQVQLTCDGSLCDCKWVSGNKYKCSGRG